jgi:hypothetical protein
MSRHRKSKKAALTLEQVVVAEEDVPASFKQFSGKAPNGPFDRIFPLFDTKDSKGKETMEGVFSSIKCSNFNGPDWVKRASRNILEGFGLGALVNLGEEGDILAFTETMGKLIGLTEGGLLFSKSKDPKIEAFVDKKIDPFAKDLKIIAGESSPKVSKAFFDGRSAAKKCAEKMDQPSVWTKINILIAIHWKRINKFRSTTELHKFLLASNDSTGKRMLPADTDSRVVRKVCKDIGLQFQNQWKKPKTKI